MSDVVLQNVRVLAIDQLADERADKPSVVKAVTLEVDAVGGEKVALASLVGTLSLMLRKAGEVGEAATRRVTIADLGHAATSSHDTRFVTIGVMRASKNRIIACRSKRCRRLPRRSPGVERRKTKTNERQASLGT